MKKSLLLGLTCLWAAGARAGEIDPGLQGILADLDDQQPIEVLVYLEQADVFAASRQMDAEKATLQRRHQFVVEMLQGQADATQGALLNYLNDRVDAGAILGFDAFWIGNILRVETTKAEIEAIAAREDVLRVYFNYEIETLLPVDWPGKGDRTSTTPPQEDDGQSIAAIEPGVNAVRAPEVWALGIDGTGVLVSNTDTGVDGNHPALRDRWAGVADARYAGHPEWAWHDPYLGRNDFPYDTHGHGTHTMGTVTGYDGGSNQIGVAPGAYWIASGSIDRGGGIPRTVADAIRSMQWLADPDGNPNTNFDVPASNSNSWGVTTGHGYPPCDQTFWQYIDAMEAAGVFVTFSAGNEGSSGLRRPADRATTAYNCNAVAAVDGNNPNYPIASFSSRGPTNCTPNGQPAIKPDIAAPGVNVRSSYPGGGYTSLSGTSMASPHINGVAALMRQANADISVDDMKQVMYETARDLGSAGEDNSYGWGIVDAYEAVTAVLNSNDPAACCFDNGSCSNMLPADCRDQGGTPSFGRLCNDVSCPQPGACCLSDSQCSSMLERDCNAAGGEFQGGGCNRACPCDKVKKFSSKCTNGGIIKTVVKFYDLSFDGETIEISIDGNDYRLTVNGDKVKFIHGLYSGAHVVSLTNPDCAGVWSRDVQCP